MPSDLRASLAGKDLPEDIKQRLLAIHEENVNLKESLKTAQDKLTKAKQVNPTRTEVNTSRLLSISKFIKQQDKLFKEQHATNLAATSVSLSSSSYFCLPLLTNLQQGTFEEAEASFRSQIKVLEEDLARQKVST